MHPGAVGVTEQVEAALTVREFEPGLLHCLAEEPAQIAAVMETEDALIGIAFQEGSTGVGLASAG